MYYDHVNNALEKKTVYPVFGSIVYNRFIVYKRKKFFKAVFHVIIVDQCNQTAR